MSTLTFNMTKGEPLQKDLQVLRNGMLRYHREHAHPREEHSFSIFLHDEKGATVGGIIARIMWKRMYIQSLWVDESTRGKGWGRKLMEAAEAEAIRRGCTHVYTDTTTYQAPDFYKKLGYVEFAKMEDYPPGSALHYMIKKLV